jgi:hypothetical protein
MVIRVAVIRVAARDRERGGQILQADALARGAV